MKPLHGVIQTLVKINALTAIIALVSFAIIREHQATIADSRSTPTHAPLTYRGSVREPGKKTIAATGERQAAERAAQLEGEMKRLRQELARTRQTVQDLLSRSPGSSPLTLDNPRHPDNRATAPYLSPVIVSLFPLLANERLRPSAPVRPDLAPVDRNHRTEAPVIPNERPIIAENRLEERGIALLPPIDPVPHRSPDVISNRPEPEDGRANDAADSIAALPNPYSLELPEIFPIETGEYDSDKKRLTGYANDIAIGLLIADRKGHLTYGTTGYRRVQTAIRLLRQGEDIENAARRSAIPVAVLQQLIKWGENRPGNLSALTEIGLARPDEP
ncbi:hypothetical protein [Pannus brasiliensis]